MFDIGSNPESTTKNKSRRDETYNPYGILLCVWKKFLPLLNPIRDKNVPDLNWVFDLFHKKTLLFRIAFFELLINLWCDCFASYLAMTIVCEIQCPSPDGNGILSCPEFSTGSWNKFWTRKIQCTAGNSSWNKFRINPVSPTMAITRLPCWIR